MRVKWKGQTIPALAFSGENNDGERKFEVHLFGLDVNLYGEKVDVKLIERLREVRHFESERDLKAQILSDCQRAKEILSVKA